MQATDRLVRLYADTDSAKIEKLLADGDIECAIAGDHQEGLASDLRVGITVWEKDYDCARRVLLRNGMVQGTG